LVFLAIDYAQAVEFRTVLSQTHPVTLLLSQIHLVTLLLSKTHLVTLLLESSKKG
jgi:hypothetical protein